MADCSPSMSAEGRLRSAAGRLEAALLKTGDGGLQVSARSAEMAW